MTIKLDEIDRKILYALDLNSRSSIADLSRKLKLGRDRIAYRIAQLEEHKVITKFATTINPYKFGLTSYKTYLRVQNDRVRLAKAWHYLENNPRIYWMAQTEGAWDLIFVTLARNPKEFHILQDEILAEFSDIMLGFSVYTLVDVIFFRKRYLVGKGSDHYYFGSKPQNHALDPLDISILELLSKDSRLSISKLANMLDTTHMVVKNRIERLQDLGIIIGYRIEVNLPAIKMTNFKLSIQLLSYKSGTADELIDYCMKNPNVTYFIQQIGDCKIEIELNVENYDKLSQIITEIRQKFPKLVRSVDPLLVRREAYRWMPSDVLKLDDYKKSR